MDLDALRQFLPHSEVPDLDELYEHFQRERGTSRFDLFLFYLYERDRISATALARVGDVGEVVLSAAPTLESLMDTGPAAEIAGPHPQPHGDDEMRFEMLETLAHGGMGAVQLARDRDLQRYVAYKHIHGGRSLDERTLGRFLFEAQVTAQLDHPNIVPVYSLDTSEPSDLGYAMKLVQGRTLADQIKRARNRATEGGPPEAELSRSVFLEHFLKVCDAIHYAHSKGVVHRDLKPQNILVGRFNEVYVADWGLARVLSRDEEPLDTGDKIVVDAGPVPRTALGEMVGTPGYMSPEQAEGNLEAIDVRSDVFSLGLVLYEIITLRRAYPGGELKELIFRMSEAEIAPIRHVMPQTVVPPELVAIIEKACARDPADRYPDAEQLAQDVRRYLRGESVSARPDTVLQSLARWIGNHREMTLFLVMGVALAGATMTMWAVYERQQTVIEAKVREEKLTSLVSTVAERAQRIERHFLQFEAAAESLAASALQLLTVAAPSDGAFFTNEDYADPARSPPDLVKSQAYRIPISLNWPVYKLAPEVAPDDVLPMIRQINPLRHFFRQTMLESVAGVDWREDVAAAERRVLDEGSALSWIYVGLEAGVHFAYPGKTGYPPEYDPRKRPWYIHSKGRRGTTWLPPYVDVLGRGLVLPCTRPVITPEGEFLGVAGVEMTLDHVQRNLLDMSGIAGIRATYLIDDQGRVVLGSGDALQSFAVGTLVDSLSDLDSYSEDQVLEEIRRRNSGQLSVVRDGDQIVLVYQRISAIGWYLVAESNPAELKAVRASTPSP